MFNIKAFQPAVAIPDVGVTLAGEIATVDVGAAEGVTDAFVRIEISGQQFLLFSLRQFVEGFCGSIRQSAADAEDRLKCPRGIDENVLLFFSNRCSLRKFRV